MLFISLKFNFTENIKLDHRKNEKFAEFQNQSTYVETYGLEFEKMFFLMLIKEIKKSLNDN